MKTTLTNSNSILKLYRLSSKRWKPQPDRRWKDYYTSFLIICNVNINSNTPLLKHSNVNELYDYWFTSEVIQLRKLRLLPTKEQWVHNQDTTTAQKDEFGWKLESARTDTVRNYQLPESVKKYWSYQGFNACSFFAKKRLYFLYSASTWIYVNSLQQTCMNIMVHEGSHHGCGGFAFTY